MRKLIIVLAIVFTLAVSHFAVANSKELENDLERGGNYSKALVFKQDIRDGKLLANTDRAIGNIIKVSVIELRKKRADVLANRIEAEYETTYKNFLVARGVGDHAGINWLLKVHAEIEFVLGETICRTIRTHDLWTLAMTIPVVFACEDKVDAIEYLLHFVPLSGIVSFWGSYAGCMGATLGTGFGFICGLASMGVEQIVIRWIAPPLSLPVWKFACHQ